MHCILPLSLPCAEIGPDARSRRQPTRPSARDHHQSRVASPSPPSTVRPQAVSRAPAPWRHPSANIPLPSPRPQAGLNWTARSHSGAPSLPIWPVSRCPQDAPLRDLLLGISGIRSSQPLTKAPVVPCRGVADGRSPVKDAHGSCNSTRFRDRDPSPTISRSWGSNGRRAAFTFNSLLLLLLRGQLSSA